MVKTKDERQLHYARLRGIARGFLVLCCVGALAGQLFAQPATQPDSVIIHRGAKVRIPILANDTGNVTASSVVITDSPKFGSAIPDSAGAVLYAHTNGVPEADTFSYTVSGTGGVSTPTLVTVLFTNALRIPNTPLNIPAAAPPTAIQVTNAFGNLSFSQPLCLVSPPGDTSRLFVCEKTGLLKVVTNVSAANPVATVFLNLPTLLQSRAESLSTMSEQGLLGLAFHPGFATNRYFYIFYSVSKSGIIYERLSRFTVQAGNPNAADTTTELNLINQADDAGNHNGGDLHFGPDGYLYVSLGDEGGGNDTYSNSQRIDKDFFSAFLRIDVDKRSGNLEPNIHAAVPRDGGIARYSIPSDNPFIGATNFNGSVVKPANVRTEMWAVGMRNPWRYSFDSRTGELWCGDVGQDAYEEVDIITRGGNYGWAVREGLHAGPKGSPVGFTSLPPIYEYPHTGFAGDSNFKGNSVTGGLVYRGSRFASLQGAYIFSDYVSGNIWALRRNGTNVSVTRIAGQSGIAGFGTDPSNGDVLMANVDGGRIYRLIAVAATTSNFPTKLSSLGVFADLTELSVNPGLVEYEPNLPFWSDYAIKRRWFSIPNPTNQMIWSRDGLWTFPAGMFWVKHFDLELERGNPNTRKRIETRLLVKTTNGVYGVSYRWNEAQTEASLVEDAGADFDLSILERGIQRTQNWHIPSRAECLTCHSAAAGYGLSFTTRQLNHSSVMPSFTGNQLDLFSGGGYFANAPSPSSVLPRHVRPDEVGYSLDSRMRSYLAVNCSYCHRAGGGAPPTWDGRPELSLDLTGLLDGVPRNNGGDPSNKLLVAGSPLHSILWNRVAATNGFGRMPPLSTRELDNTNIALLATWISDSLPIHHSFSDWRQTWFNSTNSPNGDLLADADSDGESNLEEFLTGSNPTLMVSSFEVNAKVTGTTVAIEFSLPDQRWFQVEVSTDLVHWLPWEVPGNEGMPFPGGQVHLSGEASGSLQFFRVQLGEQ